MLTSLEKRFSISNLPNRPWVACSLRSSLASLISSCWVLFSSHTALLPRHKCTTHPPAIACAWAPACAWRILPVPCQCLNYLQFIFGSQYESHCLRKSSLTCSSQIPSNQTDPQIFSLYPEPFACSICRSVQFYLCDCKPYEERMLLVFDHHTNSGPNTGTITEERFSVICWMIKWRNWTTQVNTFSSFQGSMMFSWNEICVFPLLCS